MYILKEKQGETISLPAKEIEPRFARFISTALAEKILRELAIDQYYPLQLAKKLKINEQKIYYHIRNLEKAKIIEVAKTEIIRGVPSNFYKLNQPALVFTFTDFKHTQKVISLKKEEKLFLEPFIEDGRLNAVIIVGSPDPHGPEKARSRDGYYGIDLALFLGTYLNYTPHLNVKLDTEVNIEDLKNNNLILIGGPAVNMITKEINPTLPISLIREENWVIHSSISNKDYHSDETGIIIKAKNPHNSKKYLLVLAGKRYSGTRAVIITFLKYFNEIIKGNKFNQKIYAKVVEGIDLDSDGIVDDVEILE